MFFFVYSTHISEEDHKLKGTAFRSAAPFLYLSVLFSVWVFYSKENLIERYPALIFSLFGFIAAYIVTRLVLSRVCEMKAEKFYLILVPLLPIVIHSLNNIFQFVTSKSPIQEIHAILFYWIFAILCYSHMIYSVIDIICTHLNIRCFIIPDIRLKPKKTD